MSVAMKDLMAIGENKQYGNAYLIKKIMKGKRWHSLGHSRNSSYYMAVCLLLGKGRQQTKKQLSANTF